MYHTVRGAPKDSNRHLLCSAVTYLFYKVLQNLFHETFRRISACLSKLITFKQPWKQWDFVQCSLTWLSDPKKAWNLFCVPDLLLPYPHLAYASTAGIWSAFGVKIYLRLYCYSWFRFVHRKHKCGFNYRLAIIPFECIWEFFQTMLLKPNYILQGILPKLLLGWCFHRSLPLGVL